MTPTMRDWFSHQMIYCHDPEDELNEEQLRWLHDDGSCGTNCKYCEEE